MKGMVCLLELIYRGRLQWGRGVECWGGNPSCGGEKPISERRDIKSAATAHITVKVLLFVRS
jgi:hypothetical protein